MFGWCAHLLGTYLLDVPDCLFDIIADILELHICLVSSALKQLCLKKNDEK